MVFFCAFTTKRGGTYAILQLPYNLSALFNFNEPDTNEGAMESSDEDFFDLFDFLPENTVTTNYLAKGEDRIQSLLRIKPAGLIP